MGNWFDLNSIITVLRCAESKFKEDETRFIHAKLFIIKTNVASYCLVGSANCTKAGLLSIANNGNIELCIIRREKKRDYFNYILNPEIFILNNIDLADVQMYNFPKSSNESQNDFFLTETRLEGKKLIVEYEPQIDDISESKILLFHNDLDEPIIVNATITNQKKVNAQLNDETFGFCSNPTFAILQFNVDANILQSDKRWISTQALERIPHSRDVEQIKNTHGRYGLIELLNRLEKASESPEWILYYLQWIKFEDIGESLDRARRTISKRNFGTEEGSEELLSPTLECNPSEILEKIVNRHRKKFEKYAATLKPDNILSLKIEIEKLFNMFMFLNKITLWFVLEGHSEIEGLRYIRANIENLSNMLKKLKIKTSKKLLISIIDELQIGVHMVLISYIVDAIQKKKGYTKQPQNKYIVQTFRNTYFDSLKTLSEFGFLPRKFGIHERDFNKAILDYKEFENLDFDIDQVIRFVKKLRHI